jgi:transposase InsO family protein
MITNILSFCGSLGRQAERYLKRWTNPATATLVTGALSDQNCSRTNLVAENVMLRQQLIVLSQEKRPQLTNLDRSQLVLAARCTQLRQQALFIVQSDTLLRWYRELIRRYWRRKSKSKRRQQRVAPETIALIRKMACHLSMTVGNRLWGAERIRSDFLELGVRVSKRAIQRNMPKRRRAPDQTWAAFRKNNVADVCAADFAVAHDLLFRPLCIFVIIHLQTRRIVHTAVTRSPSDDRTALQLREARPWGQDPKYLGRERDDKYGSLFSDVATGTGINVLKTPVRAPMTNAVCERFIGSLRRECLDHMLILRSRHLHHVVLEYVDYYNHDKPHQGSGQRLPTQFPRTFSPSSGPISTKQVLGGLHHGYSRATHLH